MIPILRPDTDPETSIHFKMMMINVFAPNDAIRQIEPIENPVKAIEKDHITDTVKGSVKSTRTRREKRYTIILVILKVKERIMDDDRVRKIGY